MTLLTIHQPAGAHGVGLRRAASPAARSAPIARPGVFGRLSGHLLRLSLAAKLAGASALLAAAAWGAVYAVRLPPADEWRVLAVLTAAVLVAGVVNFWLVTLALRPIHELEATAHRVWSGDLAARVPRSLVADGELARVGRTFNLLLEGLTGDRARMRTLASEIIRAGDRERASVARELHDSVAQSVAALMYQISAAEREAADPAQADRLGTMRELARTVLEEVRMLSHTVHPRVLTDLGLVAGLRHLARTVSEGAGVPVTVAVEAGMEKLLRQLAPDVATVLYRVAQESVQNAIRHAGATHITIAAGTGGDAAWLRVRDDGRGFDPAEAEARRPGMGLFTMRERTALVDGTLGVESAPGLGTLVEARVPSAPSPDALHADAPGAPALAR